MVAHHGIEDSFKPSSSDRVEQIRRALQLEKPYVLLVGNRQGYKNAVAVLNAIADLDGADQPAVLCVGGERRLSADEKRLKEKLDVRYCGYLEDSDLAALYGGAAALMVPSQYEGFGLPVIEAMACGCPVIAGHLPAVDEIGGDAVYRVDMSSADEIGAALKKLAHGPLRQSFIERGHACAAKFNWSSTAATVQAFLGSHIHKQSIILTAIVSTYNSAGFIRGCLQDLEDQTIADRIEIIVVDSASPQGEAVVVRDFQRRYGNIKYIRTANRESVYQSWNRGIKLALGKYVTNANTDDRHRRDALEQMVDVLEHDDKIALVYADVIKTRTANETFNQCTPVGMFRWHDWNRKTLLDKGCFIGPQPVWA